MCISTNVYVSGQNYVKTDAAKTIVDTLVKVTLSQKILEKIYVSNIDIPNHYPEQKILKSLLF